VASHFSSIGIPITDRDTFHSVISARAERAREVVESPGFRHLLWADSCGAAMALHLDEEDALHCVTPGFLPPGGGTVWRVTAHPAIDPECRHCSGVECDILGEGGETITRAAVQLLLYAPHADFIATGPQIELEVAAFASAVILCPDLQAFHAAQERLLPAEPGKEPMRLAETAFIPEGLFGPAERPMSERATAFFAGRVVSAARVRPEGGEEFVHLRVATLPGLTDVVADPAVVEGEPAVGQIALVQAWLVGRLKP
jgi:hypothetical protein